MFRVHIYMRSSFFLNDELEAFYFIVPLVSEAIKAFEANCRLGWCRAVVEKHYLIQFSFMQQLDTCSFFGICSQVSSSSSSSSSWWRRGRIVYSLFLISFDYYSHIITNFYFTFLLCFLLLLLFTFTIIRELKPMFILLCWTTFIMITNPIKKSMSTLLWIVFPHLGAFFLIFIFFIYILLLILFYFHF